jgi:catechol 2,3-dioxygenase
MTLQALSHAVLRVDDREAALRWYRDALGLREMADEDGVLYLGCGGDETADVGLASGGAGLVSFAFSAGSTEGLDAVRSKLDARGVAHRPLDRRYPGIETGIAFELPSGHVMEAVVPKTRVQYVHATERDRAEPLDADHINLHAADVRGTAEFLVDVLGFRISDVFRLGDDWFACWCRIGEWHHDIAIARSDTGTTLHHVSLLTQGIGHHERIADRLARAGHRIEWGIGRHGPGSNLFVYMRDPNGNRVELTAEMARIIDRDAPTRFWDGDPAPILNQWGVMPPPSFMEGT